ncbi:hypothetical protein SAMN04489760_1262 [Syntrophus gentianae]|uniref:Uncharacterized protein n=1 Tax=Syntrophus gentianae TaxID=43775 RepID=A0A1H7ZQE0_9BACT|nr:hypothetical protein SAMN04489760_1262 [Syntrophus gentianae]
MWEVRKLHDHPQNSIKGIYFVGGDYIHEVKA